MADENERCPLTEELVIGCSHCRGHDKEPKPKATGPTITAQHPGRCACCGSSFDAGSSITHSTEADGWVITSHTEGTP